MSQSFTIDARSCTLLTDPDVPEKHGLLAGQEYFIPVYQRPYSWGEHDVKRLLKSISTAYLHQQEATFLGTVQLMPRPAGNDRVQRYDIVDGQQRMTTLLLLFKVLHMHYPNVVVPEELRDGRWLTTRVNKGEQQRWLQEALALEELPENAVGHPNSYVANCGHILATLQAVQEQEEDDPDAPVITPDFLDYVLHGLHVVVIETKAGLAKTLDIFNTINTAGMALDAGDVFKIQLYEYLARRADPADTEAPDRIFAGIDDLYGRINATKDEDGCPITTIGEVLEVYKYILVNKGGGSQTLHRMATETFYEGLFALLLLGEKPEGFLQLGDVMGDDPLWQLEQILTARFMWQEAFAGSYHIWYNLHWLTRYGKYWLVDVVYLYRFSREASYDPALFREWKALLVRYYIIQSLRYGKMVNPAKSFTFEMLGHLLSDWATQQSAADFIRGYIADYPEDLSWKLRHESVFDNPTKRQLAVRLSALLEHEDWDEDGLHGTYFGAEPYDVEHIRPCNPKEAGPDDEAWEEEQHKLGNLILLERWLNRSEEVSNYAFDYKHANGYETSNVSIVKRLQRETREEDEKLLPSWTPAKAAIRREQEAERLVRFLYAGCVPEEELDALWAEEHGQAETTNALLQNKSFHP